MNTKGLGLGLGMLLAVPLWVVGCGDDPVKNDAATRDGPPADGPRAEGGTGMDGPRAEGGTTDGAATDGGATDGATGDRALTDGTAADVATGDGTRPDGTAGDGATGDGAAADAPMLSAAAQRGKYLVDVLLVCGDCHTPRGAMGMPDMTKYLAGVNCFIDVAPMDPNTGCISTKNLTNHETGLRNVTSDSAVKDMIQNGKRPDGKFMQPVMPYYEYHNLTTADADAIVAYLRTVPGVDFRPAANQAPFDPPPPTPAPPIDLAFVPSVPPDSATAASAARGRYLAAVACINCHTRDVMVPPGMLPIDNTKLFAGGRAFPAALFGVPVPPFPMNIYSQNLTQDATGLMGWTADDVKKVLKMGKDKMDKGVCPPMPAGPMGAFVNLTDADATDIANYIVTLPAKANMLPNQCTLP